MACRGEWSDVFVSHAHEDHYDEKIQTIYGSKAIYLCSDDVPIKDAKYYFKGKDTYQDEIIYVQAIVSSDEGVGFYIECEGWNLFYAGDHHLWHWEDDSEQEKEFMYQQYLNGLLSIPNNIDIACLVCDPRLPNVDAGLKEWISLKQTRFIIPIHMWNQLAIQEQFIKHQNEMTKVIRWNCENETVALEKYPLF